MLDPWHPFFPLIESGLKGFGPDLVDEVSDLEFGLPQELAVGFGGEQVGQILEVGLGGLTKGMKDPAGQLSLVGSQGESRHGRPQ